MLAFCGWIEKNGCMRGSTDPQLAMLTSLSTEDLIPVDHPIRKIRVVVDAVLAELGPVFDAMYATGGAAQRATGAVDEINGVDGDVLDPVRVGDMPHQPDRTTSHAASRHAREYTGSLHDVR